MKPKQYLPAASALKPKRRYASAAHVYRVAQAGALQRKSDAIVGYHKDSELGFADDEEPPCARGISGRFLDSIQAQRERLAALAEANRPRLIQFVRKPLSRRKARALRRAAQPSQENPA